MVNQSLITKEGWKSVLHRFVTETPTRKIPKYFKVGYDQTDITVESTSLDYPVPIFGMETVDACDTTGWTELDDAIAEVVNSTSGQFKQGVGCLNLGKSGAVSVNFGYEKNQTSKDFTSKKLILWVYIADTTDLDSTEALTIRYGSDSFNYYYKIIPRADLEDGWNLISLDQTVESTQGSPLVTGCTYTSIKMKTPLATDTITIGDIRMDYWIVTGSDDYRKAFVTDPTVDLTNLEIIYECFLDTDEAVGYLLNGFVIIDEDGNVLSIDKFEGSSKGPTDQFTFEVTDRIEQD